MSNNDNNDPDIDSVESFEEKVKEPITPENHPEEFEQINNVSDNKQSLYQRNLLAVNDEFTNEKSNLLIKLFHSSIKQYLKDPNKHFKLLVNKNVNNSEYEVIWANDPKDEGMIYVPKKDVIEPKDTSLPRPIFPIDALASDYKTDEDGTQHFPTETLKLTEENYWISDRPIEQIETKTRKIVYRFEKRRPIKYVGINFHNPSELKQVFDISFMIDQYERNGNQKEILAFKDVSNLPTDGIQIVEFIKPVITDAIALTFQTTGQINYLIVIENEMTDEQLNMFLSVNSKNEFYEKAFKRT